MGYRYGICLVDGQLSITPQLYFGTINGYRESIRGMYDHLTAGDLMLLSETREVWAKYQVQMEEILK